MKVAKCIYNGTLDDLTVGKLYDVIHETKEAISILNDNNEQVFYYVKDTDGTWFIDAKQEVRDKKLKDIGI